jgi:CheY-like chemotaxis protein
MLTRGLVAISASSLAHQQQEYLSAGFDAFISKPFLTLKESAEFHSITELRLGLDEVAQLGPEGQQLVSHLSPLLNEYDMEGIVEVYFPTLRAMEGNEP